MPSKKTHSHLIRLQVPDKENRRDFLREAANLARKQWDQAHPNQIINIGGRPSSREKVFQAAKSVFREWLAKKRRNKLTLDYFVRKIANEHKLSEKTVNKYVKEWLLNGRYCFYQFLPFQVAVHYFTKNPDSYLVFAIGSLLRGARLRQQTSPIPVGFRFLDQLTNADTEAVISERIIPLFNHLPEFLKKFQTLWSEGNLIAKFIVTYVFIFDSLLPSNQRERQLFLKTLWMPIHQDFNEVCYVGCDWDFVERINASAIIKALGNLKSLE